MSPYLTVEMFDIQGTRDSVTRPYECPSNHSCARVTSPYVPMKPLPLVWNLDMAGPPLMEDN